MTIKQIINEIINNDFNTLSNKYCSKYDKDLELKKFGNEGLYVLHYVKDTSNDNSTKIIVKYVFFFVENGVNKISHIRLINTHSYFEGMIIMPSEIKCLSL